MSGGLANSFSYGSTSKSKELEMSLSAFNPSQYWSLCESIAQDIGSIKSIWHQLERAIKVIGTAKDNSRIRGKVHQIQSTANGIIQSTNKDLQRLTDVVRRGEKRQQLQVEKLTSDYKNVVESYSLSQKQISAKMKANYLRKASINEDFHRESMNAISAGDKAQLQKQKMLFESLQLEQSLLIEQEQQVKIIERNVTDVNKIMHDLASLVHEQDEHFDTIQHNVEQVAVEIGKASTELETAARNQAKYRCKILILVAVALLIISLIVTVIVATN